MTSTVEELRRFGRVSLRPLGELDDINRVESEIIAQEVDILLCQVLECDFSKLVMAGKRLVPLERCEMFKALLQRRLAHEPLGYILGHVGFHAIDLIVTPDVLIPRPETEILVERALTFFTASDLAPLVFDVGTGSGAIVLAIASALRERFGLSYIARTNFLGSDVSESALVVARQNAHRLDLADTVSFCQGDLAYELGEMPLGEPELVVANLPYISHHDPLPQSVEQFEPELALRGGENGLELILRLLEQLSVRIMKGSRLLLEIGAEQNSALESTIQKMGLRANCFRDFHDVIRVCQVSAPNHPQ